jgi:hypothetical protein
MENPLALGLKCPPGIHHVRALVVSLVGLMHAFPQTLTPSRLKRGPPARRWAQFGVERRWFLWGQGRCGPEWW